MAIVSGRNRLNRPFFFTNPDGGRVEFPALSEGSGVLEGDELRKFNFCVESGQVELAAPAVERDPLDHDGDGRKGGSLPKSERQPEPVEEVSPPKKRGRPKKEA